MVVLKTKIIVILGPTASGKSELAIKIAKSLPFGKKGEIISADSRQVYKGLNLTSGKIEGKWSNHSQKKQFLYKGVRHHLIDFVAPKKIYSVSDFQKDGEKALNEITSRGNIPIVCGGTGLYLDAILGKTFIPNVPPNWTLRKNLTKKSSQELFKELQRIDPRRAKNIDENNPRRLIRAIEIAKAIGESPSLPKNPSSKKNVLFIGLKPEIETLKKKIHVRLLHRIKTGMIDEIKNLRLSRKITWKRCEELGLECRYVARYLQKKITKKEMTALLEKEIFAYAKRQMTWFKRNKNIWWINPQNKTEVEKIFEKIKTPRIS